MATTARQLMELSTPAREYTYSDRDTMMYALAVGLGTDPMNRAELPFVFEKSLRTLPSMATVICWNDSVIMESGLNVVMIVHGEQRITLHRPLPPAATVVSRVRVVDVIDKGPGKGVLVYIETNIHDKASGEALCTNLSTVFARGDGGIGGSGNTGPAPHEVPTRAADTVLDLPTRPNQALLYRLCGDRNPLHADPDFAAKAGFDRPILHGLCTYGFACHAVVKAMCDLDPTRLAAFEARFSAPVFPGETIRTEMWRDGETISFRASVPERDDAIVLNNGKATLRA